MLTHTLGLHSITDPNGRRGVDEKKVRQAFETARANEGATNNPDANKAAYNKALKTMLAEGAIERDGSIIRMLQK